MRFVVLEQAPSPEEYCNLRADAGLSTKTLRAAKIGLDNGLYSVCIRDGEKLIAMGRVIGDGACFFQIVDIAVAPEYQGCGLGKQVMRYVEDYLESVVHEGSYVSLIGDEPAFYQKLGYQHTAPSGHGMCKTFCRKS